MGGPLSAILGGLDFCGQEGAPKGLAGQVIRQVFQNKCWWQEHPSKLAPSSVLLKPFGSKRSALYAYIVLLRAMSRVCRGKAQTQTAPHGGLWRWRGRGDAARHRWLLHMNQPARGQPEQTEDSRPRTGLGENPGQVHWGLDGDRTPLHVTEGLVRGRGHLSRSLRSWGSTVSLWPPRCRPWVVVSEKQVCCKRRLCSVQCTKGTGSRLRSAGEGWGCGGPAGSAREAEGKDSGAGREQVWKPAQT